MTSAKRNRPRRPEDVVPPLREAAIEWTEPQRLDLREIDKDLDDADEDEVTARVISTAEAAFGAFSHGIQKSSTSSDDTYRVVQLLERRTEPFFRLVLSTQQKASENTEPVVTNIDLSYEALELLASVMLLYKADALDDNEMPDPNECLVSHGPDSDSDSDSPETT